MHLFAALSRVLLWPALGVGDGANLLPNGGFEEGLAGWHDADAERVVPWGADPFRGATALRMDATGLRHEVGAISSLMPVTAGRRYRLEAWVKQIAGYGAYKVVIEWLDEARRHLGYSNDWAGNNYPVVYTAHGGEFSAPAGAVHARLLIGVAAGSACLMDELSFTPLPPLGPRLAAYLFCAQPDASGRFAVEARVQNDGDEAAQSVRASLRCPEGLSTGDREALLGELGPGNKAHAHWVVSGAVTGPEGRLEVVVDAANTAAITATTWPFGTVSQPVVAGEADLSEPVSAVGDLLVGAYYFPVMLDWDRNHWGVRHVDYLTPLLGYYDETRPEVADWHIRWAVEHGVGFFAFDWYYNDGSLYIQDALEKGFLRSRYRHLMKFCINWCNEGQATWDRPLNFSVESLRGFMSYLCVHYFTFPEYLRVDGRPVVMIIRPDPIIEWHGGPDGSRQALEAMRQVAREHGHPDVYFMCIGPAERSGLYRRAGYDAITAYAYGWAGAPRYPNGDCEYEDLVPEHERIWARSLTDAKAGGLAYMPVVWTGWDDFARAHQRAVRTRGNTAPRFRRMLEGAARYVDPDLKLLIIEAWNEWGEGSILEPSKERGFSFLDAVRDVLTTRRGSHTDVIPNADQVASYETRLTFEQIDAAYIRRDRLARGVGPVTRLDWQFERQADRQAWHKLHLLTLLPPEGGCLRLRSTGGDPAMLGPPLMDVEADAYQAVEVRMAVDRGHAAQLFWMPDGAATFTEEASRFFQLIPDGELHTYRIALADHPAWRGIIRQLRLDPSDADGATICVASVRGVPRAGE